LEVSSFHHMNYNPFYRQVLWLRWYRLLSPYLYLDTPNKVSSNNWSLVALCGLASSIPLSVIVSSEHTQILRQIVVRGYVIGYNDYLCSNQNLCPSSRDNDVSRLLRGQVLLSLETLMNQDVVAFQHDLNTILPLLLQVSNIS